MTIGANGVKLYNNMGNASINGIEVTSIMQYSKTVNNSLVMSFQHGQGEKISALPWISPFNLTNTTNAQVLGFNFFLSQTYNATQNRFNAVFGENVTPSFYLLDFAISKEVNVASLKTAIKIGCNNAFDTFYHTHLDWNDIARKGRNFFIEIQCEF